MEPGLGFENYLRQLDSVMDEAGVERAAICGVSYGGLVALRYAATRPERVSALILVSSPAPGWTPTAQQQRWIARPWISTLPFVATSPGRLLPEIAAALPRWRDRVAFSARHVLRITAAPIKPPLMASRITWTQQMDFAPDCARVKAPTLVITGEERLDRVVPAAVTRRYATLVADARHETIERSGHIGLLTRPERFASLVCEFVEASAAHKGPPYATDV
jgi:pimeloyl-ACP methyl ester carboxylesterase